MKYIFIFLIWSIFFIKISNCYCYMGKCTNALSNLQFTSQNFNNFKPKLLWRDNDITGTGIGLGCISNSDSVICASAFTSQYISYNFSGGINWKYTSTNSTISIGWMDSEGDCLMASNSSIKETFVLISSNGTVAWKVQGGSKYNPIFTSLGMFVSSMSDGDGLLSILGNGQTFSSITFPYKINEENGKFIITSSPSSQGRRVYFFTSYNASSSYYSVIGVDLFNSEVERMKISWMYVFKDKTEMNSDVSIVYLAEENKSFLVYSLLHNSSYLVYCLLDNGLNATLQWTTELDTSGEGGIRGLGFSFNMNSFVFSYAKGSGTFYALDIRSGKVIATVDYDKILGLKGAYLTSEISYITTITQPSNFIMFGVRSGEERYLVSVSFLINSSNLPYNFTLQWKYQVETTSEITGQLNLITGKNNEQRSVVFSTFSDGIFSIGIN